MASLAELMVSVGADISDFTKNMNQVQDTMQSTGNGLTNIGKSIGGAGQQMAMAVSLPILALATSAIVVGASFDKQMSKVQAISGATGDEFDKLRDKALELGSTTAFSSSEVAMAMEELASAGFNTNQILGATSGVLSLASASGIGLAEASAITGSAINGFGLEAEDASRVADILAKASAISATNATGLGDAFKYVAPVANALGLSIEETASAIGIMADAGLEGGQAGTTLRAGLLRLASPTKEMKELMADTGAKFFDANGKMKDMGGILDTLTQSTKGMTDEQKAHYLSTLFGTEAVSGFMALMEAGTPKLDKNTEALKNSNGEAQKMAETMQNNLAGAWDAFTGALETMAIQISDLFKGDLQKLTEKLTELANKFGELSPSVQKGIAIFGLLVSAIAPLLIVIGFIAQGVGALVTIFGSISLPVLAVIAVVALLIYALKDQLAVVFSKAKSWIEPVMTAFKYLTGGFDHTKIEAGKFGYSLEEIIGEKATRVVNLFQAMSDKVKLTFQKIKDAVLPILEQLKTLVLSVVTKIKDYWDENGTQMLARVTAIYNSIMDVVKPILSDMVSFIKEKLAVVQKFWDENGTMILQAVGNVWKAILKVIEVVMPVILYIIKTVWGNIKGLITGVLNVIMGLVKVFAGLFTGNFSKMWEGVKQMFFGAIQAVWNYLNLLFIGRIVKGIGSFIKLIGTMFKGWGTNTVSFFKGMWTTVSNTVKSFVDAVKILFNLFKSHGQTTFQAFKSVLLSIFNSIKSGVLTVVNGLKTGALNVFNGMKSAVGTVFNTMKGLITKPIETAKTTILKIIDAIKGAFAKMKITIPKPKMPKVSVAMKKGVMGIPYPDFDVSWNAKGNIFNGASVLGGGQGVGEKGAEAVIPIQHKRYMAPFAKAIADHLDSSTSNGGQAITNNFKFDQIIVREEADIERIAELLYQKQKRTNRGVGR